MVKMKKYNEFILESIETPNRLSREAMRTFLIEKAGLDKKHFKIEGNKVISLRENLDIRLGGLGLTSLPFSGWDFSEFDCDNFNCYNNALTSLDGLPENLSCWVFNFSENALTNLEGFPHNFKCRDFYCSDNALINLDGLPENFKCNSFKCSLNLLTSVPDWVSNQPSFQYRTQNLIDVKNYNDLMVLVDRRLKYTLKNKCSLTEDDLLKMIVENNIDMAKKFPELQKYLSGTLKRIVTSEW